VEEEEDDKNVIGSHVEDEELDSLSAGNEQELDLEELASVENLGSDVSDNDYDDDTEYSSGSGIPSVSTGNSENIHTDGGAGQTKDTSVSGIPSTDVGNSQDIASFSFPDNVANISEDVDTLAASTGNQTKDVFVSGISSNESGKSQDIGSSVLPDSSEDVDVKPVRSSGQADAQSSDEEVSSDTAETVDSARDIDRVDAETIELNSVSAKNDKFSSDVITSEFPDTSIELQHISGNKLVSSSHFPLLI